jgi:hypothetical protein
MRWPGRHTPLCVANQIKSTPASRRGTTAVDGRRNPRPPLQRRQMDGFHSPRHRTGCMGIWTRAPRDPAPANPPLARAAFTPTGDLIGATAPGPMLPPARLPPVERGSITQALSPLSPGHPEVGFPPNVCPPSSAMCTGYGPVLFGLQREAACVSITRSSATGGAPGHHYSDRCGSKGFVH